MKPPPFIVIEGTDGSGKGTQYALLIKRLKKEKIPFAAFDFPQYGQPSAYFIEQYLRGYYGPLESIGPYECSWFYALDRFDAAPKIKKALQQGKLIIANRFTASNMGHQAAKLKTLKERKDYWRWIMENEFKNLAIPRPTLNIILHVPAEVAQKLVDKKVARKYIKGKKRDLAEQNLDHQQKTEQVYIQLAKHFPKEFKLVPCAPKGDILSIETVHAKIWSVIDKIAR